MEETNDVLALEKISSEVDESQIKVILSNQCIKAQAFLLDKLKKQSERHKETCGFISSANLKLEAEIRQAEQEINSMLIAQETIKSANVEMKKEWLVAKVRKTEVTERIEEGKKRYEALWLECKARYESIPFVQKLLRATEKAQTLNNEIESRDKQIITLYQEMEKQREICINIDRKRSIELAYFMVNEMPNSMKIIKEKSEDINNITKQIQEIFEEQKIIDGDAETVLDAEPSHLKANENQYGETVKHDDLNKSDDDSLIPKLELANFDFDMIDVNLEQVKIKKDEILNTFPMTTDSINNLTNRIDQYCEERNAYEYIISPYFKPYKDNETTNYSKRKLINILEDVHINNNEAYNIVKKVNPEKLRAVNEIASEAIENHREAVESHRESVENNREAVTFSDDKENNMPLASDSTEEADMTCSNAENIIIPPTQFLDITLKDDMQKKSVSFDMPSSLQINELIEDVDKENEIDESETANQTMNSQLDVSITKEDSFIKIKDLILKQHNLDLSLQFVYAKNSILQKREDDKIVTSIFFQNDKLDVNTDELTGTKTVLDEEQKMQEPQDELNVQKSLEEQKILKDNIIPMDIDEMIVSSPKENKINEVQRCEKTVSGLLFTHGTQAIPDSLNASISTTGFEDSDFPHCIDSNLLLSPKADVPVTGDNAEVLSQEVPNFLSGFRKTGLSFFGGGASSSESKPDSGAQNNGNNFSFNFGGEKKNRGGLFSLFQ